jgi:hypothetical protein
MTVPGLSSDTQWEPILRSWYLANFIQSSNGIYGYKGKIGIASWHFTGTSQDAHEFYPGEGIFSKISTSPSLYNPLGGSGTDIRYTGISGPDLVDYDVSEGGYLGIYLLTFNANTLNDNETLSHEKGFLANTVGSLETTGPGSFSILSAPAKSSLPESYPIDAWVVLERNKRERGE